MENPDGPAEPPSDDTKLDEDDDAFHDHGDPLNEESKREERDEQGPQSGMRNPREIVVHRRRDSGADLECRDPDRYEREEEESKPVSEGALG